MEGTRQVAPKNNIALVRMSERLLPLLESACNNDDVACNYFVKLMSATKTQAANKFFSEMVDQGGLLSIESTKEKFDEVTYARLMAREHIHVFHKQGSMISSKPLK